jgi:DNA-binding response OmpR family regulator
VLDWLLPGTDGVAICRRLRAQGRALPILMLTARSGESDRIRGLDAGADDYVAKPFSLQELKARVRAQLRRAGAMRGDPASAVVATSLRFGALQIDTNARAVQLSGQTIGLTSREFDLLTHFARHPGRAYTRAQLLAAVWGSGFEGFEHTVNSHINRLRAKIESTPSQPRFIVTVWGTGYRFDPGFLQ